VDRINADLRKVVSDPETGAWLKSVGIAPEPLTAVQYEARMNKDVGEVQLIRELNIKLD
jgi:hypothetical protein